MIAVILTCFNRKEKTVNCIRKLKAQENVEDIVFLVVDDGSKDGTREAIEQLPYLVKILKGSGNFYWAGGMRVGIQYYLDNREKAQYWHMTVDYGRRNLRMHMEWAESCIEKLERDGER